MSPPRRPRSPGTRPATRFTARVLAMVRRIPAGRIATYGDVARLAGRSGAGRAVGNIMAGCRDPGVPCHRVVGANGALGGYGHSPEMKALLLRAEGVIVARSRVRQFDLRRWQPRARSDDVLR